MKRITAIALFTIASFVTAGSALAQDHGVRATVPFDFTVGDKLLPPGTYEITTAMSGVIEIQNRSKHVAVLTTTSPDSNKSRISKLVFDKYGNQYFLSEILCQSANMNVSVPPSKHEKQARQQQAMLQNSSQVFVATK
jgi:hypothetical protein